MGPTMNWATLASKTTSHCRRFVADESGTTAIEYSIIAAGVGGAIIVVVTTLGTNVKTKLWDKIAEVF